MSKYSSTRYARDNLFYKNDKNVNHLPQNERDHGSQTILIKIYTS